MGLGAFAMINLYGNARLSPRLGDSSRDYFAIVVLFAAASSLIVIVDTRRHLSLSLPKKLVAISTSCTKRRGVEEFGESPAVANDPLSRLLHATSSRCGKPGTFFVTVRTGVQYPFSSISDISNVTCPWSLRYVPALLFLRRSR